MDGHPHKDECHCGAHGHYHHEHESKSHAHTHRHDEKQFPSIHIDTHENAVIGSVSFRLEGCYEDALMSLQNRMKAAAGDIEAADGLIGHMKAFVRKDGQSCAISLTDKEDIQLKHCMGNGIIVEGANIVFGLSEQQLENILKKHFQIG